MENRKNTEKILEFGEKLHKFVSQQHIFVFFSDLQLPALIPWKIRRFNKNAEVLWPDISIRRRHSQRTQLLKGQNQLWF